MTDLADIARRFGDGAHSIFAPSSSAMWLSCAGSLIPNLLAPDNAGVDAATGTVFHEVMETWLKSGERPGHLIGQTRKAEAGGDTYVIHIDEEMLEFAGDCVQWVADIPKPWVIETKVDFSDLTPVPRQRGTADFQAYCRRTRTLFVRDWKYGLGVKVFATGNTQGRLYAWGAYNDIGFDMPVDQVSIGIGQPRLEHFDIEVVPIKELRDFARFAKERAHAAWSLDAPRTPSPKACQWCKVRATCPALLQQTSALVDATFDDLSDDPRDPKGMSTEALAKVKRWRKTIEAWLADAEEELTRRVAAGETGHGFKMAQGRSRRAWKNRALTERVLKRLGVDEDKILTRELISPNQAEHVLKAHGIGGAAQRNLLAVLVHRPPGKPTLVEDSDPRPALPASAGGDLFDNGDTDL